MSLGATVLLTYEGGDRRWRASDGVVAQPKLADGEVSYPVPRKREQSLHTCAQDVQITRIVTI
jgi:hypothetical protein